MNKKTLLITLLAMLFCGFAFAQTVTFEIRNEQKVGSKYSFDVFMKADQNGTYHSRGQVYISYNQDAFGNAVAANGHVTVTPSALLTETSSLGSKYQTVNVADNGVNLALTWQSNFLGVTPSVAAHTSVPTAQTALYHVEIDMVDASQPAKLDFNTRLMKGQQFMLVGSNHEIPYGQSVSLPVRFVDFTATRANVHDVQVTWKTTNEYNSDHFVIEKKKNNGSFEELTRVEAQGIAQGTNEYAYLDQSGMGNENFYRIKQVDFDGTFQYTNVVMVEIGEGRDNDRFIAFPSPATTEVTLKATAAQLDADYEFTVSDVNGKTVYTGVMVQNGGNAFKINVSDFAAGTYYIRTVSPEGNAYINRFIKVNK
jgi:hypothetical protein